MTERTLPDQELRRLLTDMLEFAVLHDKYENEVPYNPLLTPAYKEVAFAGFSATRGILIDQGVL